MFWIPPRNSSHSVTLVIFPGAKLPQAHRDPEPKIGIQKPARPRPTLMPCGSIDWYQIPWCWLQLLASQTSKTSETIHTRSFAKGQQVFISACALYRFIEQGTPKTGLLSRLPVLVRSAYRILRANNLPLGNTPLPVTPSEKAWWPLALFLLKAYLPLEFSKSAR